MQKPTFLLATLCAVLLLAAHARAQGVESNVLVLTDTVMFFPQSHHPKSLNSNFKPPPVAAPCPPTSNGATLIPPQNFTQVVNVNQLHGFVNFYKQPNAVAPAFATAAAQVKTFGANPPIVFAQVGIEQNPQLASKYATSDTLIWFVSGQPQPYAGLSLQSSDIVFWVVSKIDTVTQTLTDQVFILLHAPESPHSILYLTLPPALRTSIKLSTETSLF
jgi:hypothetical protein